MLSEIIKKPGLEKYITAFKKGQALFTEGDESQDLYILVSGQLDVLKGKIIMAEIDDPGTLFGEMSFYLGARRTATIKARSSVKTIRIPKDEAEKFLKNFPSVAVEITKVLAQRLDEANRMLYGLKEFCDQLPDAVTITDKDGKILTWNTAAEQLYGRDWSQMHESSVDDIYENPESYKKFLSDVQSDFGVNEEVFKIKHPEKGIRYISTSTTALYDGHHNFQGDLSIGRDITAVKNLEKKYHRARYWFLFGFLLLGLVIAGGLFAYPYFSKGYQTVDIERQELQNILAKDYFLLKSLLIDPFEAKDRIRTTQVMKDFFDIQVKGALPYNGLLLLDKDKWVFDGYSLKSHVELSKIIGSSYAGIAFQGSEKSLHTVLTLYRTDESHPMGSKGIEIAFEMNKNGRFLGWLVFQMNTKVLEQDYNIGEKGLRSFRFVEP
jgi:PAS domain S-box-containing protein